MKKDTANLRRKMRDAVRSYLEDGYEVISVDDIIQEVTVDFPNLESISKSAAAALRDDIVDSLPEVKKKIEQLMNVVLVPITQYCLDNYVAEEDGTPILLPVDSESEAIKCVAGGRSAGQCTKTAGYARNLVNPITRQYYQSQKRAASGMVDRYDNMCQSITEVLGMSGASQFLPQDTKQIECENEGKSEKQDIGEDPWIGK